MAVTTASLIGAAVVAVAAPRILSEDAAPGAAVPAPVLADAAPTASGVPGAAPFAPGALAATPVAAPVLFPPSEDPTGPKKPMTLATPDKASMRLWEYETGRVDAEAIPTPRPAQAPERTSLFASELRLAYLNSSLDAVEQNRLALAAALAEQAERVGRGEIPPRPAQDDPSASADPDWVAAAEALARAEQSGAPGLLPVESAHARAGLDCWRLALVVGAADARTGGCADQTRQALAAIARAPEDGDAAAARVDLAMLAQPAPAAGPSAAAAATARIETASTRTAPRESSRSFSGDGTAAHADGFAQSVVYFALDSAELTAKARAGSRDIGEQLAGHLAGMLDPAAGGVTVSITGHADSAGAEALNDALSLRRAEAVRDAMAGVLPAGAGVELRAFGERAPHVPTADGVIEPKNRRVEITVGR